MKALFLTLAVAAATLGANAQQMAWQDPTLPIEQRADDLLGRLTLEEKASLMMNGSPAIERLGIKPFDWWSEALHGVGRNGFATVFPITMGMAASWDDALVQDVFTAVSDEARVKARQARSTGKGMKRYQGLSFWTPNINIFRDPRWGRGQETYGEDPFLTARMGVAVVRGLQGPDSAKYRKLLACAKHYAVHSGPEWNRHTFNIEDLPERDLWETYMPAFKALVQEAGVEEVMCAYQRVDGEPCCAQTRYEQQILRDEWGFKGLITSDCGAISDFLPQRHNVVETPEQAVSIGVRAGTDVECGSVYKSLPNAVRQGLISEKDIDTSLRRLLIGRLKLGEFDPDDMVPWNSIPESVVASKEHKQMALQIAREGVVLLQNNGILPLKSSNRKSPNSKIVVVGPNANDSVMMWGNYNGYPTATVTILKGLQDALGKNVRYVPGCGLTDNEVSESRFNLMRTPDGKHGMRATYWNNEEMEGKPVATAVYTEPINLSNGGATVFAPGVSLTHFSARYEGVLTPTADEKLQLHVGADDLMRLIVNGDTLVNAWSTRNRTQEKTREVTMKAGQSYRIQIDYVQQENMANMQFDISKKYVPTREELLAAIGDANVVVFAGGISPRVEGEEMKVTIEGFKGGDRTSIELPKVQRDLIRTLHDAGKRIVFLNCSGGAVALTPESQLCDAILQVWYGGEKGGQAVADVLTGKFNPCGKLPVTFYKDDSQLPDFLDYRMAGRTYRYFRGEPLYPFGHGLSYTTFVIERLTAERSEPSGTANHGEGSTVNVQCNVTNTGKLGGTEVVQVYLRRPADVKGPLKTLCGYQRVSLKAGERRTVTISLPRERFEVWDEQTNTMRVIPGDYELMVGSSSADSALQTIKVTL